MPAKPKPKKKQMTLDGFAVAIQQDLARMATKDDIHKLRENMATKQDIRDIHKSIADIREDVKQITDNMVSKADLANTIREELDRSPYAKEEEVKELRHRVLRLEGKLGIKADRRAA